jgi:SAM-dependent methyltransferase
MCWARDYGGPVGLSAVPRKVLGRLFPMSRFGPSWFKLGDFYTFKEEGFAAAPSIPTLMARQFYELKYILEELELLKQTRDYQSLRSLEIGCGYGRLSPYIGQHFKEHHAIDINATALGHATQLYPGIIFREASVTKIPYPDRFFDLVISWTVLQHIPPNFIDGAIREIERVRSDCGVIILCEATRFPDVSKPSSHTQDRKESFYEDAFPNLRLVRSTYLTEIDSLPGMKTPGRFMVFKG